MFERLSLYNSNPFRAFHTPVLEYQLWTGLLTIQKTIYLLSVISNMSKYNPIVDVMNLFVTVFFQWDQRNKHYREYQIAFLV